MDYLFLLTIRFLCVFALKKEDISFHKKFNWHHIILYKNGFILLIKSLYVSLIHLLKYDDTNRIEDIREESSTDIVCEVSKNIKRAKVKLNLLHILTIAFLKNYFPEIRTKRITSALIGACEVKLEIMTDQPTDKRTYGLIGKSHFQKESLLLDNPETNRWFD